MEKSLFRKNIDQSLKTLEDLYSLGDSKLYPLIERLHFHLHEIEDERRQGTPKLSHFSNIERLLQDEVQRQVSFLFRSLPAGVTLDVINAIEKPHLSQLDQIISAMPWMIEASHLFEFKNQVRLWLDNDCFSLEGEVSVDLKLEDLRDKAYALTRQLFKQKILLTFEVFESSQEDHFRLKFHCHLAHSDQRDLIVPISDKNALGISGSMLPFKKSLSFLKQLGEHQVFVLENELKVDQINVHDVHEKITENEGMLFHFPFLFRPLSLIIKKAKGADSSVAGRDHSRISDLTILELDLFSLIQK